MRFKKQKRHRRAVRFYTTCFGFRQPFKVLCDGTFVHHLIANRILPADDAIANVLGGPVKLFATRCVVAELKSLGSSHSESLEAAHKLSIARCDHEKRKRADTCIMEVIGENNPEHFFVASQDADLRKKLQEVPAVPLIFGLRNALFLEPPSASQRQFVKNLEEKRLHMTDLERKLLEKRTKKIVGENQIEDSSYGNESQREHDLEIQTLKRKSIVRKGAIVKDKPQFKKKKAGGPNPLSILRKKKPQVQNPSSDKGKSSDSTGKSRNRKRKRSHKGNKPAETEV